MVRNYVKAWCVVYFLLSFSSMVVQAQGSLHLKIGQRSDRYVSGQWQGVDSFQWTYQNALLRTSLTAFAPVSPSSFTPNYRFLYTYTPNELISIQTREQYNGSTWVPVNHYLYQYNTSGNLTQIFYETWSGSQWNSAGKIDYDAYNAKARPGSETYSNWNGSAWVPFARETYQYYANDTQQMFRDRSIWNLSSAQWDPVDRYYFTYLQDSINSQTYLVAHAGGWLPERKQITLFQTSPFQRTEFREQRYDTLPNPDVWVDDRLYTYQYNTTGLLSRITASRYLGSMWEYETQTEYLYNTSDQLVESVTEKFLSGAWESDQRFTQDWSGIRRTGRKEYLPISSGWQLKWDTRYQHDTYDSVIYQQTDTFQSSVLIPYRRDFFYYDNLPLQLAEQWKIAAIATLFPNPVQEGHHLSLNFYRSGSYQIKIIDIMGSTRMLVSEHTERDKGRSTVPLYGLPAGHYVLIIYDLHKKQQQCLPFRIQTP